MGLSIRWDASNVDPKQYSIALITEEEATFPEFRRSLSRTFKTTLATTEAQIEALVNAPELHGMVLDLDSIGSSARDGIEVLHEIRKLRQDLILVAITHSTSSDLSLAAR